MAKLHNRVQIRDLDSKTRRRERLTKIDAYAHYKIPEELVEVCLDPKLQINKEVMSVNSREELLNSINLYGVSESTFRVKKGKDTVFVEDNFVSKEDKAFVKLFGFSNVVLRGTQFGDINSMNNFLLYLKFYTKIPCYTYRKKFMLRNTPTRAEAGKKINSKSILLMLLLDELKFNKHKRDKLIESGSTPFSYVSIEAKKPFTSAVDENKQDNVFEISYNNILSISKLYINALRIARALFVNFQDPKEAYEQGLKIVKANMAPNTSLFDNIFERYEIEENNECDTEAPVKDVTDKVEPELKPNDTETQETK